jgi:hypothetical protein
VSKRTKKYWEMNTYAPPSPIEPSAVGGGKIARAVSRVVTGS